MECGALSLDGDGFMTPLRFEAHTRTVVKRGEERGGRGEAREAGQSSGGRARELCEEHAAQPCSMRAASNLMQDDAASALVLCGAYLRCGEVQPRAEDASREQSLFELSRADLRATTTTTTSSQHCTLERGEQKRSRANSTTHTTVQHDAARTRAQIDARDQPRR